MKPVDTTTRLDKGRMVLEAPVSQIEQTSDWGFVQNTLMIQREPRTLQVQGISPELHHRYEIVQAAVAKRDLPVRLIGYAPVFSEHRLYPGRNTDWVIMPLPEDPTYTYNSGQPFYIPTRSLNDLRRVHRSGIHFESIFIAHEIPKNSLKYGDQVPLELIAPPPPQRQMKNARRAAEAVSGFWDSVVKAVTASAIATVAVAGAALFAPAAAVSVLAAPIAAVGLDPIIFGLHIDERQKVKGMSLAMWYYITHWTWDEE